MAGSGDSLTYRELDDRSNQLARLWHEAGLRPGDHVAIFSDNDLRYFVVFWAALRSGLYLSTVNRYLTAEEAGYIVDDCGASALVASHSLGDIAVDIPQHASCCEILLMWDGVVAGFGSYEDAVAGLTTEPLAEQPRGSVMLYSSGTTGQPKGIKRPLDGTTIDQPDMMAVGLVGGLFGMTGDTVYLSPAPLYHSAPLGFSNAVISLGGTVVVMEKFDPTDALAAIERHRVTHSQWVPTMFTRMLKLPAEDRLRHDLSSHVGAVHAAAPCPVEVKRQMIEWWGPILLEYYAGTEANGFVFIDSATWLDHAGSVGQPILGVIHICDDEGSDQPVGEVGTIYFERDDVTFEYHGDPQKTRDSQHPQHPNWSTLGDMGYLDEEGFLFLTDRKAFMIISGGINIYPQEIEDALVMHPAVTDVAVFGVPDPDMGEEVKAVVELAEGVEESDDLTRELLGYARDHLAGYKVPRTLEYTDELPRLPTGKLYKRVLRDRYWADHETHLL
jgi:fatty-acyl-CoA synthase